ncbi:MAG TPA: metallophosphoesterase [Hyphomicrobiaceae bacterium]|nr:metallophosphoesterase [Hyphomicrobiaceae bacterium]
MTTSVTVAHLSDVHLGPIAGFTPRYWNLKRALGYANWLRRRRHAHLRPALERLTADLEAQAPDHVAITGDLVNIGLPQEHANALAWLEGIGTPERVSVIPGNHDIYSWLGDDPGTDRWACYMASNAEGAVHAGHGEPFPFVRMLGRVALIGVNSAVPTPPFIASGRVGAGQLARLASILDRLGGAEVFRLVLVHHPPLPGQAKRYRDLQDADDLQTVLARHGAELVLHGHNHLSTLAWCGSVAGQVPVVGAPSASLGRPHKKEPLARYNLYRIAGPPWTIELIGRGLEHPAGDIVELERRMLTPGER